MICKLNCYIGLGDIGRENKAKNKTIFKFFEDVAGIHSDMVGYGANNIKDTRFKLDSFRLESKNYKKTYVW